MGAVPKTSITRASLESSTAPAAPAAQRAQFEPSQRSRSKLAGSNSRSKTPIRSSVISRSRARSRASSKENQNSFNGKVDDDSEVFTTRQPISRQSTQQRANTQPVSRPRLRVRNRSRSRARTINVDEPEDKSLANNPKKIELNRQL